MPLRIRTLLSLLLALLATGCFFDFLAWSPDGRYLVYPDTASDSLLRYDTETSEQLVLAAGQALHSPRYGRNGTLYAMASDGLPTTLLRVVPGHEPQPVTAADVCPPIRQLPGSENFLVVRKKSETSYELLETAFDGNEPRVLFAAGEEFYHPVPSPDGERIAFVAKNRLMLWQRGRNTSRTLAQENDAVHLWPGFLSDKTLLYTLTREREDFGMLMALDLDSGQSRLLCPGVVGHLPWSLHPDGKRVALSVCAPLALPGSLDSLGLEGVAPDDYEHYPAIFQILEIDLDSGAKRLLTRDSLGGLMAPSYHPGGRRLACLQGDSENTMLLHILGLDGSGERRIVGVGSGRAELARAEQARHEGPQAEALDIYAALLRDGDIAGPVGNWCHYRLMEAALAAGDQEQALEHAARTGQDFEEQARLCLRRAGIEPPPEGDAVQETP